MLHRQVISLECMCTSFSCVSVCPSCFLHPARRWEGVMLLLLSHMLYSNNNIWRVTSGCGLQHKPRRMTNELSLSLAHIPRSHLKAIVGVYA